MSFPHPSLFFSADPYFDYTGIFARAPWLDPWAYRDERLMSAYVTAQFLPGDIHVAALSTRDWHLHCALPDSYLHQRNNESQFDMRRRFAKLVYQRTRRWIGRSIIPHHLDTDIWVYRTDGEIPYVAQLLSSSWSHVGHTNNVAVAQSCLLLGVQLPQQFRYVRRVGRYWGHVRWEREARSRTGFLVSYHNVEIDAIRINKRARLYVPVPSQWRLIEAPEGLRVEMAPCVAYRGCEIINNPRECGLWRVLYTEYIVKVAVAWLWEQYDSYRMFFLPMRAVTLMRSLDLSQTLGSSANASELNALLDIMSSVDWDNPEIVPFEQNARTRIQPNFAPGRRHATCGDWVYFNPWDQSFITKDDAAYFCENPFEIPENQPIGHFFWEGSPAGPIPTVTQGVNNENMLGERPVGPSF